MDGGFDMVSAADVKEGFLCPICMSDLGNVSQLHQHFEDRHADEDKNTLKKFRDILGKNKIIGKILNKDDEDGSLSALASAVGVEAKSLFGGPSSGEQADCDPVTGVRSRALIRWGKVASSADHTGDFKRERRKKLDRNKSVNQVLTRLERLMTDLPRDPAGRRAHEQAVVAWIEADHVKLCPTCAKGFNVARRKHHCRLCGCVMCGDCSVAVSFELARRVLNPASVARFGEEDGGSSEKEDVQQPQSKSLLSMGRKLAGSNENLNALANLMEQKMAAEPQFRSCKLCLNIVEGQERRFGAELEASDSEIVGLFTLLGELEKEGAKQAAMYVNAVDSLKSGEEEHNVSDVKRQRMKLALIAEKIAGVGKSIRDGAAEKRETPLRMQLRRNIYQDAVNFVKSNLVSLPDGPTEQEFDDLRSRRVREAEDRVEEERREARVARMRAEKAKSIIGTSSDVRSNSGSNRPMSSVSYGSGLVLTSSAAALTSSDDPMVQQIRNLREFIREATRLGRRDEVKALEENLAQLQDEYAKSQKERRELEDNYDSFKGIFHKHSPAKKDGNNGENSGSTNNEESSVVPQEYVDIDDYDASGKNPFFDD